MFLIRTVFWLTVVALVVPPSGSEVVEPDPIAAGPELPLGRDTLKPADLKAEWRGPQWSVPI